MTRPPVGLIALLALAAWGCVDLRPPGARPEMMDGTAQPHPPDAPPAFDGAQPEARDTAPASPDAKPAGPEAAAPQPRGNGVACSAAADCASGFCVDGVCCNSACTGVCYACHLTGSKGSCAPVAPGEDPRDACAAEPTSGCGRDGTCNGAGSCRLHAAGTSCAAATCAGDTASAARTCDGAGTCRPALTKSCAPYRCASDACKTTCTADADCVSSSRCDGATKSCVGLLPAGASCGSAAACLSGFCVDGVCCTTACAGTCHACNLPGAIGVCAPVPAGTDPGDECAPEAATTCGRDGVCDGAGACRKHASGTQCAAASCTGTTQTAASRCDGGGRCVAGTAMTCAAGQVCSGASCTPNASPTVNAGPDASATTTTVVTLAGSVTDDGLPSPPGATTTSWSKVSGPGTVTFTAGTTPMTTARFSVAGSYVLRLTASDGAATASDDVTITVSSLDQALIGLWRFDEGTGTAANDSAGGGNTAFFNNSAAWTTGRVGKALDVSGGDQDYALVARPTNGRFDLGTDDFTVAVWVKTSQAIGADLRHVIHHVYNDGTTRHGWELMAATEGQPGLAFKIWSGDFARVWVGGTHDGQWHHVVGRKKGSVIEIYLDGQLRASEPHALGSLTSSADLKIGGTGGRTNDFDGALDEFRFYRRALDASEIAALAGGASP